MAGQNTTSSKLVADFQEILENLTSSLALMQGIFANFMNLSDLANLKVIEISAEIFRRSAIS